MTKETESVKDEYEGCDSRSKLVASGLNAKDIFFALHELRRHEFRRRGFTFRECQIASRLLDGESNDHIAAKLYLSPSTVKYHLKSIYGKTNCKGRSEFAALMQRAMQNSHICWR